MQITLKVCGNGLASRLGREAELADSSFTKIFNRAEVSAVVTRVSEEINENDFICNASNPEILILDNVGTKGIERVRSVEKRAKAFLQSSQNHQSALCPIIITLNAREIELLSIDFPDGIADWIYAPVMPADLAQRVLRTLKWKQFIAPIRKYGAIRVIPEIRVLSYEGRTMRLTPTELLLAELFLNQIGSIISLQELATVFSKAGKSMSKNNIRVAMFQLRLKLEILTKSQFSLNSIYKQGYSLRHRQCLQLNYAAAHEENSELSGALSS